MYTLNFIQSAVTTTLLIQAAPDWHTGFVEMNKSSVSPFADQTIKERHFEKKLCRWIKCQERNTQREMEVLRLGHIGFI